MSEPLKPFDPKNDPVPEDLCGGRLANVSARARGLLKDFSSEEILQLISVAEWLIETTPDLLSSNHSEIETLEYRITSRLMDLDCASPERIDRPIWKSRDATLDKFECSGKPIRGWELVAAFSLRKVAVAMRWDYLHGTTDDLPGDRPAFDWMAQNSMDAVELICRAERLEENYYAGISREELTEGVLAYQSESKARAAAMARHTKTHKIEEEAIRRWLTDGVNAPSVRQFAKSILPDMIKFARDCGGSLSNDRGEQTIQEWISKYRNKK